MPVRRIALITNGYPDIYARERSFILPELKALLAYGHQVTLVPVREVTEVDPDLPDGVAVERRLAHLYRPWQLPATVLWMMFRGYFWREAWQCLGRGRLRYLGHFFKESVRATNTLRMQSALRDYDVLYTYWFKGESTGISLMPGTHARRLTRAHGYDLYEDRPNNEGYIPYREMTLPRLDRVVVLSEEARAYLEQRYPASVGRTVVSPLGVAHESDENPGPEADRIVLVSCSYPTPNKRLPLIGQLAAAVACARPSVKVVWMHFGCRREEAGLPVDFAGPPNLSVQFAGEAPNEHIRRWYATRPVSFFVNLSQSEGQPVSIMEAMAFGIPVMATGVGGIPEMLRHGGGMTLPEQPDVNAVAREMLSLLDEPSRYQAMREAARETQLAYFNTSANHRTLADLIGEF